MARPSKIMEAAFFNGRAPRSVEYKAGTRMALEHRIEPKDIVPSYETGTPRQMLTSPASKRASSLTGWPWKRSAVQHERRREYWSIP
jgi:hypothetical protein